MKSIWVFWPFNGQTNCIIFEHHKLKGSINTLQLLTLIWQKCFSISLFSLQVIFIIITIKESLSRKERSSHWKVFFEKVFFIATWYWQICGFPYFRKTAARTGIFWYKSKFFFREQANSWAQLSMFYRNKLSQL